MGVGGGLMGSLICFARSAAQLDATLNVVMAAASQQAAGRADSPKDRTGVRDRLLGVLHVVRASGLQLPIPALQHCEVSLRVQGITPSTEVSSSHRSLFIDQCNPVN